MIEPLSLPPNFVVGQLIRRKGLRRQELPARKRPGRASIESAGPEALRIGVINHHVWGNVPSDVAAALEAVIGRTQVQLIVVVAPLMGTGRRAPVIASK